VFSWNGIGRKASIRERILESSKEVEVLDAGEGEEVTDGIIEDEDDEESPAFGGSSGGGLKVQEIGESRVC
jgi:hypothetical protein